MRNLRQSLQPVVKFDYAYAKAYRLQTVRMRIMQKSLSTQGRFTKAQRHASCTTVSKQSRQYSDGCWSCAYIDRATIEFEWRNLKVIYRHNRCCLFFHSMYLFCDSFCDVLSLFFTECDTFYVNFLFFFFQLTRMFSCLLPFSFVFCYINLVSRLFFFFIRHIF